MVPANSDPKITASAPAAKALTISPLFLIPPSAISVAFLSVAEHSIIDCSVGYTVTSLNPSRAN